MTNSCADSGATDEVSRTDEPSIESSANVGESGTDPALISLAQEQLPARAQATSSTLPIERYAAAKSALNNAEARLLESWRQEAKSAVEKRLDSKSSETRRQPATNSLMKTLFGNMVTSTPLVPRSSSDRPNRKKTHIIAIEKWICEGLGNKEIAAKVSRSHHKQIKDSYVRTIRNRMKRKSK